MVPSEALAKEGFSTFKSKLWMAGHYLLRGTRPKHRVKPHKLHQVGATPTPATILRLEPSTARCQAKDVLHSLGDGGLFFQSVPSYGWQAIMFYTYVIESIPVPKERYFGHTTNLKQRLSDHDTGKCVHTSKFKPWKLKLYVAFETIEQAQHFEKYLKSGSGHAFANRHLWTRESPPN